MQFRNWCKSHIRHLNFYLVQESNFFKEDLYLKSANPSKKAPKSLLRTFYGVHITGRVQDTRMPSIINHISPNR